MIESLDKGILECDQCNLRSECQSPVTPSGHWDADIMVVDAIPGSGEETSQVSFSGVGGRQFQRMMKLIGVDWGDIHKTTLTKCRPAKGEIPDGGLADTCGDIFLRSEIGRIKPKIIITLGSLPTNYLLGDQPNFHNATGRPRRISYSYLSESYETIIFPMYEMVAMGYQSEINKSVWSGFRLLAKLKANGWTLPDDETTDWREIFVEDLIQIDSHEAGGESYLNHTRLDDLIFLDTEWSPEGTIWCITMSNSSGEVLYLDVSPDSWFQHSPQAIVALRDILRDRTVVMHNALADIPALGQLGIEIVKFEDTYIMAYILQLPSLGLKNIATSWAGMDMSSFSSVAQDKDYTEVAETYAGRYYACRDVEATRRIFPMLWAELTVMDMMSVYRTDMGCLPLALEMMENGILVNPDTFAALEAQLTVSRAEALAKCREYSGEEELNVNSHPQVSKVLFDTFKLPKGPKTKTGWSTSRPYLEKIETLSPVVPWIIEYRRLDKLINTYVQPIPKHASPMDGRVRAQIKPATAETGRWASGTPLNLQNQPSRDEEGRQVREGFEAAPGMAWLSVDQSQIELRTLAHRSRDPGLIRAFQAGIDIHTYTASQVHGIELDEVSYIQRRDAKFLNFGVPYGIGAVGVFDQANSSIRRENKLKIQQGLPASQQEPLRTLSWAKAFISAYFGRFPGIRRYHDEIKSKLKKFAYVESLSGRRRYIYEINMKSKGQKARAERQAINMPIQELAAYSMKKAMGETVPLALERLRDAGIVIRPLIQVHDSLDFEVGWNLEIADTWTSDIILDHGVTGFLDIPQNAIQVAAREIIKALEDAYPLIVPTTAEASFGPNWGNLKPVQF